MDSIRTFCSASLAVGLAALPAREARAQDAPPTNTAPATAQPDEPPATTLPPAPGVMPHVSMNEAAHRAVDRAPFIRDACRAAGNPDFLMWFAAGGLIAAGGVLATVGLLSNSDPPSARPLSLWFAVGVGPGLVLGGIGVPFARGLIDAPNPLSTTCHALLRARPQDVTADDLNTLDRLLVASGRPDTPVLPILLGIATAGTGALTAIAVAVNSHELTQIAGGVAAAVVTGWFLVPPTPQRSAALRYARRMNMPEPVGGVPTPVAFQLPYRGFGTGLQWQWF